MLAKFLLYLQDSLISSVQLTHIIAPALKESKIGSKTLIWTLKKQAIIAKIGSAIPVKNPIKNAFDLLTFSPINASETDAPSGIFCSPIPKASITALTIVKLEFTLAPARATPMHIPSGILCKVMAKIINKLLLLVFKFIFFFSTNLSKTTSPPTTKSPPKSSPKHGAIQLFEKTISDCSTDGISREKIALAIIIPALKASKKLINPWLCFLTKKTVSEPIPVNSQVNKLKINVWIQALCDKNISILALYFCNNYFVKY